MIAAWLLAAIPSIVPWPRSVQTGSDTFTLAQTPRLVSHLYTHRDHALGNEGYALSVTSRGANAWANTHAGLFYAAQTFAQLGLRAGTPAHSIQIRDVPLYRWRGVHLDTARHFFDVPTIEKYIDVAAHYKLNVFHWHLTDDQAWRLPVPGYPALTARGYAYSEGQVREVVRYAAQRYVTVLPEIEMPAHASAAIGAYPQYGCGRSDLFCATPATFRFLEGALRQVFTLFPGEYVHAGGDEVPANYNEAAFFVPVEAYLRAHNRRMAVWNEALSPRLSTSAIVMAWNSMRRAAEAARRGNDTVVTGWPLYFDAAQGDAAQEPRATRHMSTLAEVYSWSVMPAGLAPPQEARVLGGEAALWTERIRTPGHLFYMLLPRELALSEILWTPHENKNWNRFVQLLPAQFAWLDARGYTFRVPNAAIDLNGGRVVFTAVPGEVQTVDAWTQAGRVIVSLSAPIAGTVRYTTDGAPPSSRAQIFAGSFARNLAIGGTIVVRAVTFFHGRGGAITECRIHRVTAAGMPQTGARSWSALVSP